MASVMTRLRGREREREGMRIVWERERERRMSRGREGVRELGKVGSLCDHERAIDAR